MRHQLEKRSPLVPHSDHQHSDLGMCRWLILKFLEIVRAPEGESWLGLQGPSGRAELSPIPTAIPNIQQQCVVDCVVTATGSNYLGPAKSTLRWIEPVEGVCELGRTSTGNHQNHFPVPMADERIAQHHAMQSVRWH